MFADPLKWSKALPWAEYWYNTSYHISAAMTPFKALYGHGHPALIRSKGSSKDTADLQSQLAQREELLSQLLSISTRLNKLCSIKLIRNVAMLSSSWVITSL
jgi:hypothetical protein